MTGQPPRTGRPELWRAEGMAAPAPAAVGALPARLVRYPRIVPCREKLIVFDSPANQNQWRDKDTVNLIKRI